MKKYISLFMALPLCFLLFRYTLAESADGLNTDEDGIVNVVLIKLDVNDQTLEVDLKIINNTDHDIWICNGYDCSDSTCYFDRYMAEDDRTLILRRRYNLSSEGLIVERFPSSFRYLRLSPGQEKVESHSFTLSGA